MLTRMRKALRDKESGFTLVELLVVVIIIGILAAIAIPLYMNQKQRGYDATVKSDLKNIATQLETHLASEGTYPTATTGFTYTEGNGFVLLVAPSGANAGYVVYGKNVNSENVYYLSSYGGSSPTASAATTLTGLTAPAAGDSVGSDAPGTFPNNATLGDIGS